MKHLKHMLAASLAVFLAFVLAVPAFAQTVGTATAGTGSITITNAANGETYRVYKLFDATVSKTVDTEGNNTSIAYTGTIPTGLASFFEKDDAGNIKPTAAAVADDGVSMSDGLKTALTTWVESKAGGKADEVSGAANADVWAESDGSELKFAGLPYGYYVVTTTQGELGISVDSTNPNPEIIDKNTTPPVNNLLKASDDENVFIGQLVTYTISFDTANYDGEKQIVKYEITDVPATNSLNNITVTSIMVDADADLETTNDQTPLTVQQFENNKITINWAVNGVAGNSLYKNGAKLVITYTAVVADTAAIDGTGNKNQVEIKPILDDGTNPPDEYKTDKTIFTYALAIKKVDQAGKNLAGATFQLPFYVKETKASDGAYIYAGTTAGNGLVNTLTTPDDGLIIIKGVEANTYSFTETAAPAGYNKLTAPVSVEAKKIGATTTSTTTYLDKDGNIVEQETTGGSTVLVTIDELAATPVVVVNKTGAELPSTGGMGTTILYVVGGILVVGGCIALVTKRRMTNLEK